MNDSDVVYEAHFAMPGSHVQPSMLRLQVDYSDGAVYLVRSESHYPEASRTRVYRFDEPQDDDWRAGHGVALDSACRMLHEVASKMGILGYKELPSSPGWAKPAPCVFENYVTAERSRHPLPTMH